MIHLQNTGVYTGFIFHNIKKIISAITEVSSCKGHKVKMFNSFHTFHKSLLTYTLLIDFKEEINNILSIHMGCKSSYLMTFEDIDGIKIHNI